MPLLKKQVDLFPEDLLESSTEGHLKDRRWWVMYTLSRREKQLMRRLHALEIPYYGPTIRRRYQAAGGRRREAYCPLFSNYVFVCAHEDQRRAALGTRCISRTLAVYDGQKLQSELRHIKQVVAADVELRPESRIVPGDRVAVRSGPLAGVEGIVNRAEGRSRLVVIVDLLQKGASLLLEDWTLEKID